jgi:hypothetical protein
VRLVGSLHVSKTGAVLGKTRNSYYVNVCALVDKRLSPLIYQSRIADNSSLITNPCAVLRVYCETAQRDSEND